MAETMSNAFKWSSQLHTKSLFRGARVRRGACRKLAACKTAQVVPFLVSALANRDDEIRRIAKEALLALTDSVAIEALYLGYVFTKEPAVQRILNALGRHVPDGAEPLLPDRRESSPLPSPAEEVWQLRNSRDQTVLAFIPEGGFLSGKENVHVHLPAYYLAYSCVTNAQYARFLTEQQPSPSRLEAWISLQPAGAISKRANTYAPDPQKADFPAVWVTQEGAAAYCRWAGLRLPNELEWEKGARGVDGRQYPWGDEWEDGRPRPAAGERKPEEIASVWAHPSARSPYGLYQMIGNVYEWCSNPYEQTAHEHCANGNSAVQCECGRVLRGGPWCFGTPAFLRTEYRKSTVWRAGTLLCGFRCAKDC